MYGTISILHISDIYKQYTPQPPMYDDIRAYVCRRSTAYRGLRGDMVK